MKINNLKINGFGKLKDKEIEFSDTLNVIYGKNESGKSTLLKFIPSMLYGASKNKNGKDISDQEKYAPWDDGEFSGKITYTLDNGDKFSVYREFRKKNPVIYNRLDEDVSKEYTVDRTRGIEFFEEQTGIDEETFLNTAISEQEALKLSQASQNSIIQKISNLISTGDDKISYKKTAEKLTKMQNERVGTDRTSQKPINLINNRIDKILVEKKELESYKDRIFDNREEKEITGKEVQEEENKRKFLKELKKLIDKQTIKDAEIDLKKKMIVEDSQMIDELNSKIESTQEEAVGKFHFAIYIVIAAVVLIAFGLLMFFNTKYRLYNFLSLILLVIDLIVMLVKYGKYKHLKTHMAEILNGLNNELSLIVESKERKTVEVYETEKRIDDENTFDNKELYLKYVGLVDEKFIEKSFEKTSDELEEEIDLKENRINTMKFRLNTIENADAEIIKKVENLTEVEEELAIAENEKEDLLRLNDVFNICKEALDQAYNRVKESISPRFIENLCDIISKVSGGRYKKVSLNDKEGLNVEVDNGSIIPVSRLSVGTIDQMYLSLRLSALYEISNESIPIVLDESFAYFDNERLDNILKYLARNFPENQILLFTCSKREINALDGLDIKYNLINLEK